jgi:hypothetical protein
VSANTITGKFSSSHRRFRSYAFSGQPAAFICLHETGAAQYSSSSLRAQAKQSNAAMMDALLWIASRALAMTSDKTGA